MKALHVKGRYLYDEDVRPFFYLGDTAWELFHVLSREEAEEYLRIRKEQDFTVIQAVALAEKEGLTVPNAYHRLPFKSFENGNLVIDDEGPYSYWDHVDYIIRKAEELGLYVALLPTWGDKFNQLWGKGPEIFTPQNAYIYGKWIGNRYKKFTNIIWMLGGDRPLEGKHREIIDAMAQGIKDLGDLHLMTFHPTGGHQSTEYVEDAPYISFHTAQTGHNTAQCYRSDEIMLRMRKATNKPYMDSESRYEDHPACFKPALGYFWDASDVRQNAYWDVLSGACGLTYGNHSVWSMTRTPNDYFIYSYKDVLHHPGAEQMRYLKALMEKRDYSSFEPLDLKEVLVDQNPSGIGHFVGGRGKDYVYIYTPLGLPIKLQMGTIFSKEDLVRATWFNPRTGEEKVYSIFSGDGIQVFVPSSCGKGADWVLILEKAL